MSEKKIEGVSIDNLLYTTEDTKSSEKTQAELTVPDPSCDKALGVLQGQLPAPKDSTKDESSTD